MVEFEEPAPHRTTNGARGRPDTDSHDDGGEPALGCHADSWRTVETGDRRLSGDGREIHGSPTPAAIPDLAHVLAESHWADRGGRFLHRPDGDLPSLVRLVLLAHDRRRIRHIAVTAHPTAAWTAQQLREAFPWDEAPRYLLHDRDRAFDRIGATAMAMGIEEVHTAPRAPWQNAFVERFTAGSTHSSVVNRRPRPQPYWRGKPSVVPIFRVVETVAPAPHAVDLRKRDFRNDVRLR
jgi:hypothetical protein